MKTKLTSFFAKATIALLLVILAPPTEAWAQQWSDSGDGTLSNPYQIKSYAELKEFAAIVNGTGNYSESANPSVYAILMNDIVCKNDSEQEGYDTNWTPIGNESHEYTGTFDGRDPYGQVHTITGLSTPTDNTSNYVGLFGYVGSSGTVQNVILVDANITGNRYVGGIAGYNSGPIQNCALIGTSNISSCSKTGGIVGCNNGTIKNCYVAISGSNSISAEGSNDGEFGGIVGQNEGIVENCHYSGSGDIGFAYTTGGIVGNNTSGTVRYCYYAGTGTISGNNIGAIIGKNSGRVENSYYKEDNTLAAIDPYPENNVGTSENVSDLTADEFKVLSNFSGKRRTKHKND